MHHLIACQGHFPGIAFRTKATDICTIALLSDQNHLTSSYRRMAGSGKGKGKGKGEGVRGEKEKGLRALHSISLPIGRAPLLSDSPHATHTYLYIIFIFVPIHFLSVIALSP